VTARGCSHAHAGAPYPVVGPRPGSPRATQAARSAPSGLSSKLNRKRPPASADTSPGRAQPAAVEHHLAHRHTVRPDLLAHRQPGHAAHDRRGPGGQRRPVQQQARAVRVLVDLDRHLKRGQTSASLQEAGHRADRDRAHRLLGAVQRLVTAPVPQWSPLGRGYDRSRPTSTGGGMPHDCPGPRFHDFHGLSPPLPTLSRTCTTLAGPLARRRSWKCLEVLQVRNDTSGMCRCLHLRQPRTRRCLSGSARCPCSWSVCRRVLDRAR